MDDRALIRARSFWHWKYCMKESLTSFPKWVSIVLYFVNFFVALLCWVSMVLFMNGYGFSVMSSFGEDYARMFSFSASMVLAWILVAYLMGLLLKGALFALLVRSGRFDKIGPVYKVDEL